MRGASDIFQKDIVTQKMNIAQTMTIKKPKTYITYLDINNLYGNLMSQYLPYGNSRWLKNINEIEQKIMKIKSNSSTGYISEVDLEYPKNLHYEHSNYPLAPQKITDKKNGCQMIV